MKRMLLIARFEYTRQVKRRAFLLAAFGIPVLMLLLFLALIAIALLTMLFRQTEQAVGYVDQANVVAPEVSLANSEAAASSTSISLQSYPNEEQARQAFVAGTIDAYVVIPPDYLATGQVNAYGQEGLSLRAEQRVRQLLLRSILETEDPTTRSLVANPLQNLRHRQLAARPAATPAPGSEAPNEAAAMREIEPNSWLVPLAVLFGTIFLGTVISSSGYLLQALIEEKENRTMEIIVTSVSPEQLIGGKTLGLGALGLTLSMVWLSYGVGAIIAGMLITPLRKGLMGFFSDALPVHILVIIPLLLIPAYFLYAGIIITIGAMVTSVQEGQQLASLALLPAVIPLMALGPIQLNPDSPFALGLSFIPFTAPVTLMIRLTVTQVPLWQVGLSLAILVGSAVLMVGVSARIFRLGMLRYDAAFKLRELLRLLVQRQPSTPS